MIKTNFQPGRYDNLPAEDYHKDGAISNSQLSAFSRSPADWLMQLQGLKEETAAMRLGTLAHLAVLEPDKFGQQVVCSPDIRRGTNAWKEFELLNAGKLICKPEEYGEILAIQKSVLTHPIAKQVLSEGVPEISYFWKDETGMACKARMDWQRKDGILVDLKTVARSHNATPDDFARHAVNFRYYVQAAWYRDGTKQADPFNACDTFIFITVETDPPYHSAVFRIDNNFVDYGRTAYRATMSELKRYLATPEADRWNGYRWSDQIQAIEPPYWFAKSLQEKEEAA